METVIIRKKKRQAISKGMERICSHTIEWWLEGKGLKLSDTDIEHIQNSLIDNYVSGELCTITPNGDTANGWWGIQW
jgi:hypothetical protein